MMKQIVSFLVLLWSASLAFASEEPAPAPEEAAKSFVAPEDGWTEQELRCLNLMEDADTTYDHMLNHHEYFVFADLMANKMFGVVDALDETAEWELDELYEQLLLLNPRNEIGGIDIFGSAYGALRNISEEQEAYLKEVCKYTREAISIIGDDK